MNTPEYEREEQYDDIYYPNAVQSSARPFDIFNTSNRQVMKINQFMDKSIDSGMYFDGTFGEFPDLHPWWLPFLIIVGLVIIILIVVAFAVYCGLRGTFDDPPTTPRKKRFNVGEEDSRSEKCSSVKLDMRSESRATCGSFRTGINRADTTELQTLLSVPSNSQANVQSLEILEKVIVHVNSSPLPPERLAPNSAEDEKASTSSAL